MFIGHGVWNFAHLEGGRQIANGIAYRMRWRKAQFSLDLFRRDVIRTVVVSWLRHNLDILANHALNHVGNINHRVVFIARIEDFAVDQIVIVFQRIQVQIAHILNVDIGSHLVAAKHSDFSVVDSVVSQDVYGQVKAQARLITTYSCRAQNERDEARRALFQKIVFAHGLVF